MSEKCVENPADGQSRFTAGLGGALEPVAWRRTDTPRSVMTEDDRIARGWAIDGLFFEAMVSQDTAESRYAVLLDLVRESLDLTKYAAAAFAFSEQGKGSGTPKWFEGLREQLESLQPRLINAVTPNVIQTHYGD